MQNDLPNDLISALKLMQGFKKSKVQQVKIWEKAEPGDEVTYWGDTGPCRVAGLCSWEMFNLRNAARIPSQFFKLLKAAPLAQASLNRIARGSRVSDGC